MAIKEGRVIWSDYETVSYVSPSQQDLRKIYSEKPELIENSPVERLSYLMAYLDYPTSEIFEMIHSDEAHKALMTLESIAMNGSGRKDSRAVKKGETKQYIESVKQNPSKPKKETAIQREFPSKGYISLDSPLVNELYNQEGLDNPDERYSFLLKKVRLEGWGSWAEGNPRWKAYSLKSVEAKVGGGDRDLTFILLEQIAEIEIGAEMIMEVLSKRK